MFRRIMNSIAFKSIMITVNDRASKLTSHIAAGRPLTERAGPFGDAHKYAADLMDAFLHVRRGHMIGTVTDEQYASAAEVSNQALARYRDAGGSL